MNYTPELGWYYIDANQKAPAWTGVIYFYNFLTRSGRWTGPVGREVSLQEIQPGDFIQLSFDGKEFQHTPIVVQANQPQSPENILLAAHSFDADNRPLSTYSYQAIRFLHIEGILRP